MRRNYQRELEKRIEEIKASGQVPRLLLHSCCAPCSSYVLEYLAEYFSITVFFYNPNITEEEEYRRRVEEQKRLILALPVKHAISFLEGEHDTENFLQKVKGMEDLPEGGARCEECFKMRLGKAAQIAQEGGYDYFTTTLSISPLKNAEKLNEIGESIAEEAEGISYLNSDFKKKNGYKRSVELSGIYDLYRQDYCGCVFSKAERERQKQEKTIERQ